MIVSCGNIDHLRRSRSVSCAGFRFLKRRPLRMRWRSTVRRAAPASYTRRTAVSCSCVCWWRSLTTTTIPQNFSSPCTRFSDKSWTRRRASTSMYSPTFRVHVTTPRSLDEMERRTQKARPFYRRRRESSPARVVCVCCMRAMSLADYRWAPLAWGCPYTDSFLLARQPSVGRLMLCFCYFFHLLLFNDRLEQRDLGNYKTDIQQIFRVHGRHVGVDVQSSTGFRLDGKADGRVNSAQVL